MKVLSILILFCWSSAFAQELGEELVDTNKVINWYEKFPSSYAGEYHFGFSEGESTLRIIYTRRTWVAQIRWAEWDDAIGGFVWHFKTLTTVQINENGSFLSEQHKGRFVYYLVNGTKKKGLRINNPWGPTLYENKYEIGLRYSHQIELDGKYPQASLTFIPQDKLNAMTSFELKIMRNEIFARYGYIFRTGGAMETYFRKQNWYSPAHKNVDAWLTLIEKENIIRIRKAENQK